MTEPKVNALETKKKAPEYFSSLSLLGSLYEEKKIRFDEYLEFFSHLSSYRFRFLRLTVDDIEKAVFGDGLIKIVKPDNIRKFNFRLTMSEEYGVPFQIAFKIVTMFFISLVMDNTVTFDIAEKIFIEIIETFPTGLAKKDVGQLLLKVCTRVIENNKSKLIFEPENQIRDQKINKLLQLTEVYNWESKIWKPM